MYSLCVDRAPLVLYFDRYHVGGSSLFVGFTAVDVVVLVSSYRSPSLTQSTRRVCILWGERSTFDQPKQRKIMNFFFFVFFMCILMNFICLWRASISMEFVVFFVFNFISFKWPRCLGIAMNDAPVTMRERERDSIQPK